MLTYDQVIRARSAAIQASAVISAGRLAGLKYADDSNTEVQVLSRAEKFMEWIVGYNMPEGSQ